MTIRVIVQNRVVSSVSVAIEELGVGGIRHNRIRADEPPQRRVVPAGVIVVQPRPLLPPLPGEAAVGGQRAVGVRWRGGSILRLVSGSKFQVASWGDDIRLSGSRVPSNPAWITDTLIPLRSTEECTSQ